MDPDCTLADIANALASGDYGQARELKTALVNWLARGGFAPQWKCYPDAADYVTMNSIWET